MVDHLVSAFSVRATRARSRDESLLPLDECGTGGEDILDVIDSHIRTVPSLTKKGSNRSVEVVAHRRSGQYIHMVTATDITGENEPVRDPTRPSSEQLVFIKQRHHVGRTLAAATLWRPDDGGTTGILLVHNAHGRVSRNGPATLLQRALTASGTGIKLGTSLLIPPRAMETLLRTAATGRMRYTGGARITSKWTDNARPDSASARGQVTVVVGSIAARPLWAHISRHMAKADGLEKLLTVDIGTRGSASELDGEGHDDPAMTFDDIEVELKTPVGPKFFSLRDGALPSMGFNLSSEFNAISAALDAENDETWAEQVLDQADPIMTRQCEELRGML